MQAASMRLIFVSCREFHQHCSFEVIDMLTLPVLKNHSVCAIHQNRNTHKLRHKAKSYLDRIQLLLALGRVSGVPQLGNCVAETRNAEPRDPGLKARSSIHTPAHCTRERRHVCSAGNYTLSHRHLAKSKCYGPLQPISERGKALPTQFNKWGKRNLEVAFSPLKLNL
ncbi:unnamed protein product [Ixodes persulcatus]